MKGNLEYFKNFNKTYYITDGYDDYLERFEKQGEDYVQRLVGKLKPKKFWKFLDIGCGMGGTILALRKFGYRGWGIEVSQFCLKNSPAKKWMRFDDICSLPFSKNSLDVVLCIDTLCYLTTKEAKRAVKELSRITKKYLFIETICQGSPNADQKRNPDPLRKDNLPSKEELISFLRKEKFELVGSLFNPGEKLILSPFKKVDFNYIFTR